MISIVSFIFFTGLVGFISWWRTKDDDHGEASSYFLAGKSLPWFVVAGSLMLTNLSTEQLIGLNGSAYLNGTIVMAWEVVAALALVVMALYFLPRYWNNGITTVPQFLEKRFDPQTRQILSGLFLVFLVLNFLPFVLYSGALGMNGLFSVDELLGVSQTGSIWIMVWAIGIIGALYAVFGGLKAVAVSDTINGVGLLVGGLAIPILGLIALGDGSMGEGLDRILTDQKDKISPIGDADSAIPFGTLFTGMALINIYYWCTNQAIVQRTFGAKSLVEGQKGVLAAAFLKLLGPLYLVLPGIIALEMFGDELGNGDSAYPRLVAAVLPPYLAGLFGAVMFGAILSSFNSALHSCSTLFGLDIYQGIINPKADGRRVVWVGKVFGIVLAIFAMCLAPVIANAPDGLFTLMKKLGAIFNIPILAVIVMAMTTRSVPAWAAKICLFGGMATYCFFTWGMGETFFGMPMHWMHFAGLNFAFLCVFMFVAGKLKPSSAAAIMGEGITSGSEEWSAARWMSALVVIATLGLYIGLHVLGS
ncbi:MAG: solute:sodium symporter family transporter [Synoicihabitans sp.]